MTFYRTLDEYCFVRGCQALGQPFKVQHATSFEVLDHIAGGRSGGVFQVRFEDGATAYVEERYFGRNAIDRARMDQYDPSKRHSRIWLRTPDEYEGALLVAADKERQSAAASAAAYAKKSGVRLEMTKAQVLSSKWGRPASVNKTVVAGLVREQWVYDGGYLYFDNGLRVAIQN